MSLPCHEDVNTGLVSKVLVLYTGGTIGMVRNSEEVLVPARQALEANLRSLRTLHDPEFHATAELNQGTGRDWAGAKLIKVWMP